MAYWDTVAADVSAALAGPELNLTMALRRGTKSGSNYAPTITYTYYAITGAQFGLRGFDDAGTFIGMRGKRLLVSAAGTAPQKGDEIMIDGAVAFLADTVGGTFAGIPVTSVDTVSPAGTAVLYRVFLEG